MVLTGGGCFAIIVGGSTGTEIKQFIQSVFGEGLFGADKEFFVNAAFAHADPVNLADGKPHGSGQTG